MLWLEFGILPTLLKPKTLEESCQTHSGPWPKEFLARSIEKCTKQCQICGTRGWDLSHEKEHENPCILVYFWASGTVWAWRVMAKSLYLQCFLTIQILDASVAIGFRGVMASCQSRCSGGAAKYDFTDFGQNQFWISHQIRAAPPLPIKIGSESDVMTSSL